jgi:hypothetical protein
MIEIVYDTTKTWGGLPAPLDWRVIERRADGIMWQRLTGEAIKVIESSSVESDGRRWLHVSVSKPNRKMPTYDDLQAARKLFVGEDRECYQVFPPQERYVNFNPVLHLWVCLDMPQGVLPQFEGIVNGVRTV